MFNVLKLTAASIALAITGGFLLSVYLPLQGDPVPLPAAETSSPEAATPAPSAEAPTADAIDQLAADEALVLEPGTGETVAGFTQIGRRSTRSAPDYTELRDLQAVGDTLVAHSSIEGSKETSRDVIVHSDDGMTWIPVDVPGAAPQIEHLVSRDDGLLAGGSVMADDGRQARLWASANGVDWTVLPAPPAKQIQQIVSSHDGTTAVRAGNNVWISLDGGEWEVWNKMPNSAILEGPGGLLVWQGGGQDRSIPTSVLHWDDFRSPLNEVILPEALQWGQAGFDDPTMGVDIFALDDEWVMIGSEQRAPDTIHVSANGLDWEDVPRPPGMIKGSVRWVARVGDQVQAFGNLIHKNSSPGAIWTWTLGDEAAAAETLEGTGDEWIDTPVAWRGGYVATGYERGREQFLTLWRTEADPAD